MHPARRSHESGQMIVIMALGLVAIIAMVALVVEGGNAFAQQRISQNGSDAAATAGALVVADELSRKSIDASTPPGTNASVYGAIQTSVAANNVEFVDAEYTDDFGTPIGVPVTNDGNPIPNGAEGVRVGTTRIAGTTFARVLGINELRASADATVVAGALAGCPEGEICGVIPVTFPVAVSQCDGNDLVGIGTGIDTDLYSF